MRSRASGPRRRLACLAGISAAAILACSLAKPTLTNVQRSLGANGRVEIGRLEVGTSLIGAAFAQAADATLENVTIDLGAIVYRIPRAEFFGANVPRAELASLFDTGSSEPAADRLARLSAAKVSIPELTVEQAYGSDKQVTIYRDVVATYIVGGRIASLSSAGGTVATTGAARSAGSFGRMTITDLDLPLVATLYSQAATSPDAAMKKVHGAFSLEDLAIADPQGPEIRMARIAVGDFKARPAARSWNDALSALGAMGDWDKAAPAERSQALGALADLFESFELGPSEITGLEARDPSAKDPATVRVARIAYSGATASQPADIRVEGFDIAAGTGSARIAAMSFAGFSFKDTFQGLKGLGDEPVDELDGGDWRKLIPTFGTWRMSGIDFDLPDDASKTPTSDNIRFSIKDVEVTADKPINGIPTNLRVAVENLALAVPPDAKHDGLEELAAMGYRNLDVSLLAAASWNEARNELALSEITVRGADMGGVSLRGLVGNLGRDAFNPDSAIALVALVGASARTLDLTIENKGLFERMLAQQAKKQRKSVDDLRREYGMAAAIAIPAMLGNAPAAKSLGQSVARFIAKPGRLAIQARAKDAAGLGLADLATLSEPAAILDKLDITATAE